MKKAVFLDRDGTLIKDKQHLCDPKKIDLLHGVIEGLQKLREKDFLLFIITNQSGIGRGLFPESSVHNVHAALQKKLEPHGILFTDIFFCPHHPDDGCICRKPSPHFVRLAEQKHDINLSKSFFIGDKDIDAETGKNAGTKTICIQGSYNIAQTHLIDFLTCDFLSGVEWILEHDQQ